MPPGDRVVQGLLTCDACFGPGVAQSVVMLTCPTSGSSYAVKRKLHEDKASVSLYVATRVLTTPTSGAWVSPVAAPDVLIKAVRKCQSVNEPMGWVGDNPLDEIKTLLLLSAGERRPSRIIRLLEFMHDEVSPGPCPFQCAPGR
jgi:hypothetical protein